MSDIEILAQAIGIVAMVFNIFSYQCKNKKILLAMQMTGAGLFSINYILLGATVGGILNIVAVIRALVFLFKEKFKADKLPWFIAFIISYISIYVLNFTLFGKEPTLTNLLIEILPVIGMLALNIGYMLKSSANVRKCGLVSSPSWLIYNISVGSWGAIICEIFTLSSILIGILRLDRNKGK